MNYEASLRRAVDTGMHCAATFGGYEVDGEWEPALRCTRSPGHTRSGDPDTAAHGEWIGFHNYTWNTVFGSVHPGGRDTTFWTDDDPEARPSPWTDEELGALDQVRLPVFAK